MPYRAPVADFRFLLAHVTGFSRVAETARFAEARLGNWNRQERVLSGRLDDFVVLSRVMPADEMLAFFEATKPY